MIRYQRILPPALDRINTKRSRQRVKVTRAERSPDMHQFVAGDAGCWNGEEFGTVDRRLIPMTGTYHKGVAVDFTRH